MRNSAGQLFGYARRWQALLYWASLLLAIAAMVAGFRYQAAPTGACAAAPEPSTDKAGSASNVVRYRFAFQGDGHAFQPWAISIGEGLPFYRLTLNGADLTPSVDLTARDRRDIAPHLHVLPADLLRPGRNTAELELPVDVSLGDVRVDQVCVGSRALLEPSFRANWWRMLGLPTIFAMVLCILIGLAAALWLLSARQPAYLWYVACMLLMLQRTAYVSTSARPGTPLLWILLCDMSVVLLPYALYRFMCAYWQFSLPWLARILPALTGCAVLCTFYLFFMPVSDFKKEASVALLLLIVVSDLLVIGAMASRLHSLHAIEKQIVVWTGLFAFSCSFLEIANLLLPLEQRWAWASPLGSTVFAIGLGYLLVRRMALGADVLSYAAGTLAKDLDYALAPVAASGDRVWAELSASITKRERGRMLRDIHDGFGSRLVTVLTQARRELPQSSLQRQIQRALLDMRLMMDAMDESSRSLGIALASLRHRVEPLLTTAEIASEWQVTMVDGVTIDDRRKLMSVFRCLEELFSNCLQHAGATRMKVDIAVIGSRLRISIEDNGCGIGQAQPPAGRGLDRAMLRARAIGGSLRIETDAGRRGCQCVLTAPLF
jgi:hypothetical protein